MRTKKSVVAGIALLLAAGASAQERVFSVTNGDWNNGANWTGGDHIPGAGEIPVIRSSRTANITNDVGTVSWLSLGQAGSAGTLNLLSGKLVLSDESHIGRANHATHNGSSGTLKISGGTLQVGGTTGDKRLLIGVNQADATSTGLLEVSGTGTFIGRAVVGSSVNASPGADIFRIVGSDVTVGCTSGGNSIDVRDSGVVQFIFDADGIATSSFGGNFIFSSGSEGIVVDGSAYTGPAKSFTLLTATLSATAPKITLTGFAAGTTYDWDGTNNQFTMSVIPEPATLGLVGLGALALMAVRRCRAG